MERPYRRIDVERAGVIFCVRLRQTTLSDEGLEELGAELARLLDEEGCHKLALCLGPAAPECLVSVFFAKLVHLQRRLEPRGLVLAEIGPFERDLFRAAGLEKFFRFYPDRASAVAALQA